MFSYQVQHLVISAAGAEAKDEQVSVRIRTGEVLPIWRTLTVKQRTMPLTFNLKPTHINHAECREDVYEAHHFNLVNYTKKTCPKVVSL